MATLVTAYAACSFLYVLCLYAATTAPVRWPVARQVLCTVVGARWRGDAGIVLQNGIFGCAHAALSMIYGRLRGQDWQPGPDSQVSSFVPSTMLDVYWALRGAGLEAKGYEFESTQQLCAFLDQRPSAEALLLLREYGDLSLLSIVLLFPHYLLRQLGSLVRRAPRPILHWVVLHRAEDTIDILDPFLGRVSWSERRFAKVWTRYGLIVSDLHK